MLRYISCQWGYGDNMKEVFILHHEDNYYRGIIDFTDDVVRVYNQKNDLILSFDATGNIKQAGRTIGKINVVYPDRLVYKFTTDCGYKVTEHTLKDPDAFFKVEKMVLLEYLKIMKKEVVNG